MSVWPRVGYGVAPDTARVAAFPHGSMAMRLRDRLGELFSDSAFTELYARRGRPGFSPASLALVSVLQFVENLTDRQAAGAVRGRIDWKYALGLGLADPGFDASVLSEFRFPAGAGSGVWADPGHGARACGGRGPVGRGWAGAHGLHCGGRSDPGAAHSGVGRRDAAGRARGARCHRPGVGGRVRAAGVVRALRATGE